MTNEEIHKAAKELYQVLESCISKEKAELRLTILGEGSLNFKARRLCEIGSMLHRSRIGSLEQGMVEVETLMHEVKS